MKRLLTCAVVAFVYSLSASAQHDHHHGEVEFATSCNAEANEHIQQGVAILHHMMYEQAEPHFAMASESDPGCAFAHWGVAMTQIRPLWAPPTADEIAKGRAAIAMARSVLGDDAREQAYVAATEAFFEGEVPFPRRLAAWEAGWARVREIAPDDVEAAAFHLLAGIATAPRNDKTFARNEAVGAELIALHTAHPQHPGFFHYTIHAHDNPVLARKALDVARGYDKLAPNVPHALHMPSHIFVRLGYWDDVISWNRRSADAALAQPVNRVITGHYPHAIDYLVYANLQKGQHDDALAALNEMLAKDEPMQSALAAAYGLAASRARVVLEREDWEAAANLEPRVPATYAWDEHPAAEAIIAFARGLGAARAGDPSQARYEAAALDTFHDRLVQANEDYWAVQVDAQRKSVRAWTQFASGDQEGALALMREAADVEDSVDKHPVTPSAVRPARELLGDMLLLMDRPAEAREAYEQTLAISPGRRNALRGMALAAEQLGAN